MEKQEKKLIEAALFISSRAMSLEEFRSLTGIGALGYLQGVLAELKKDYDDRGSALEILEADGKYSIRVRDDCLPQVKQFAQDMEISKGSLRILAYISRNDGIMKSELVKRIGTHVYDNVRELVEAGFVRPQKAGRSAKLFLTEKFKRYFVQAQKEPAPEAPQTTL